MSTDTLNLKIEFGGGLELLFSNQRSHRVTMPVRKSHSVGNTNTETSSSSDTSQEQDQPVDLAYLVLWLRDNLLKERTELFVENGTVCVNYTLTRVLDA